MGFRLTPRSMTLDDLELYLFLQYFDTVGWVFWSVKTVARITYILCFGGDVKPCSINQKPWTL